MTDSASTPNPSPAPAPGAESNANGDPSFWEQLLNFIGPEVLTNVACFVGILIIAWILANIISGMVVKAIDRSKKSPSALFRAFCKDWSKRTVRILGIIVALETIGVATAPLIAGLGVAGFVIGFAVQGTLSNFASGMMLLIYQPFDEGQVIETNGVIGKVVKLSIVSTTLLTPDNREMILPNSSVWGSTITNITSQETRRIDLVLGVGYDTDLDRCIALIREAVTADEGVLEDPAITVEVLNWGESSVDIAVRPWCKTADYWDVFFRLQKGLKQLFDREGIDIPFPQRVVHLQQASAA